MPHQSAHNAISHPSDITVEGPREALTIHDIQDHFSINGIIDTLRLVKVYHELDKVSFMIYLSWHSWGTYCWCRVFMIHSWKSMNWSKQIGSWNFRLLTQRRKLRRPLFLLLNKSTESSSLQSIALWPSRCGPKILMSYLNRDHLLMAILSLAVHVIWVQKRSKMQYMPRFT